MRKIIDITDQRFGSLVAIKRVGRNKYGKSIWLCHCDCGKIKNVLLQGLRCGQSQTCGHSTTKHGLHGIRLYHIWNNMKQRCLNSKKPDYFYYGARGITVCDDWQNDFMNFYNWAMAHGYSDNLTIDRINNDGDYEPDNCQWATMKEQRVNQRPYQNRVTA